jgi:hypothetical protein
MAAQKIDKSKWQAFFDREVIDGEGVSQIIKLREPLMLPAPGQE